MKTKGALVWELNQPWSIDEIEIGDPRRGEVTVQLETAGLCHSDQPQRKIWRDPTVALRPREAFPTHTTQWVHDHPPC
jgi:Zn-dependent alcohol dehydrogenase